MPQDLTRISLAGVNCYLLRTGEGYVLVDTGYAGKRGFLEKKLADSGCRPGDLKLIILTHGDIDHAGNAAYLRERFGAKIAMHRGDARMAEHGDMGWNRKKKSDRVSLVFRILMVLSPLFASSAKFETFVPDFLVDESYDLSAYGLDAKVVGLPGHSKGSIGVLTASGDLICGDFVYNMAGFKLINDFPDHVSSMEKVRKLDVTMIYPGHGKPISVDRFRRKYG